MFEQDKKSSSEVFVNLMASLTRTNRGEAARTLVAQHKSALGESYDLVYNSACALIEGNDLEAAESQLRVAESQCRAANEIQDASNDDLNAELAPILTQMAYVKQRRGDEVGAAALYEKVLSMDLSDQAVIAVCNNNLVALRGRDGGAPALSRLANLTKTQVQDKLSTTQRRVIQFNRCILLLQNGKFDDLNKLVKTLDPTSEFTVLIQAATLIKKGQTNKAIETLRESIRASLREAPSSSTSAIRIQLSLAQIQMSQGNIKEAIGILKSITSIQHEPAMLATLVTLYQKVGELGSALAHLDEVAAKLMQNKKTMDVAQVTAILKKSADLKLANSMWTQATETLTQILQLNPGDLRIKATLALALASVDPSKAEQFLSDVPKLSAPPGTNIEALEVAPTPQLRRAEPTAASAAAHADSIAAAAKAGLPIPSSKDTNSNTTSTSTSAAAAAAKKKKKKRKNKPAKKATPGQTPDPERWIPRQLRKGYKTRRGAAANKQGHAAGHQGTAANEAINKANTAAPSSSKTAPPASKVPPRSAAAKKRGGKRR
jgi:signal recognition particle subunit SRP72